jgi:hypothetical protein
MFARSSTRLKNFGNETTTSSRFSRTIGKMLVFLMQGLGQKILSSGLGRMQVPEAGAEWKMLMDELRKRLDPKA